ncbi:branched-chain amino acid aminotransferase [Desulfurivibrio alkaliphilus]|uniref:Branched-chain-amino-acid aminotransferase n=1 Tax=Desulfurivibrio alkaliphilus (strain DSM 19089 / UNIQEM U267 / AHT2) TaxID=589865 RepID=D6Z678_DESAT|nr:branched-chain amino acid aminotransferase [Desulfurivibrio alkaliphilus]ADH86843.1 branched-chain amino acid aminotransferase [Desulfurivibrio alkaliphilus AHT 2]
MEIKTQTLPPSQRRTRPDDQQLGFGRIFTDHMLVMPFDAKRGWHDPEVRPYAPFSLDPAAMVLHYGQAIFEGLKAYRGRDDGIYLFRPLANLERMNRSAVRMCMPTLPVDTVFAGLKALLKVDGDWVPSADHGASLYIRPTMVATEAGLGVRPAQEYLFYVILSPVGAYYPEGFNPVKIYVTDKYVRAVPGGVGEAKTAGNYAASIMAAVEAQQAGYTQVLWLDAKERRLVEEVGTMNIFFVFKDRIVTPPLSGTILPGITRDSVLRLLADWDLPVEERSIAIDEVFAANERGELQEVFGTGTAAVISPVGSLHYRGQDCQINQGKIGELALKLFNELTAIQYGRKADPYGWVIRL